MWGRQTSLLWLLVSLLCGKCFHSFQVQSLRPSLVSIKLKPCGKVGGRKLDHKLRASDGEDDANDWDEDDLDPPPAQTVPLYHTTSVKNVEILENDMRYRTIPNTDISVSELALGTMNFGDQLGKKKSFSLLDHATKACAINFIDTAEIYPFPFSPHTSGKSEMYIGEWMAKQRAENIASGSCNTASSSLREKLVISTKVCGYANDITWMRPNDSPTRLSKKQIIEAVDGSLKRLGTDYIDLLQFHWPDRRVFAPANGAVFQYGYEFEDTTPVEEQLAAIDVLMKSGKIRSFGLSDETPFGVTNMVRMAEQLQLPRPVTLQIPLNLLAGQNDLDLGLAEACAPGNLNVALLAHTPLAGGALTGKYQDFFSAGPNTRMRKYIGYQQRYIAPPAAAATKAYLQAVSEYSDIPPAVFALSWVYQHPSVFATILGATSVEQLQDNVQALNVSPFPEDVRERYHEIYMEHRDPTKGLFTFTDPEAERDDASDSENDWGQEESDFDPTHEPAPEPSEEENGEGGGSTEEKESDLSGEITDDLDESLDETDSNEVEDGEEEEESADKEEDHWVKLERFLRAKDREFQTMQSVEGVEQEADLPEEEKSIMEELAGELNEESDGEEDVSGAVIEDGDELLADSNVQSGGTYRKRNARLANRKSKHSRDSTEEQCMR